MMSGIGRGSVSAHIVRFQLSVLITWKHGLEKCQVLGVQYQGGLLQYSLRLERSWRAMTLCSLELRAKTMCA